MPRIRARNNLKRIGRIALCAWGLAAFIALLGLKSTTAAESSVRFVGETKTVPTPASQEPPIRLEVTKSTAVIHTAACPVETSRQGREFARAVEDAIALRDAFDMTNAQIGATSSRTTKAPLPALTIAHTPIEPISPIGFGGPKATSISAAVMPAREPTLVAPVEPVTQIPPVAHAEPVPTFSVAAVAVRSEPTPVTRASAQYPTTIQP